MSATISECGRYRFDLDRKTKAPGDGSVLWVMLNPSTANADEDDATIRMCIGFTELWGFARLRVVNLFAFRATDPKELRSDDILHSDNIEALLRETFAKHDRVVFAWGGGIKYAEPKWVADYVARLFSEAVCLGHNKDGTPKHPLYLKYETQPIPYEYAGAGR